MNAQEFTPPFAALCVAYGREATEEVAEVYLGVLRALDVPTWKRVVAEQIQSGDRFLPPPGVLLERARGSARAALDVEAVEAFRRTMRIEAYHPEHGTFINVRRVRELLGPAAAHAVAACGGPYAMMQQDDYWLAKTFAAAYVQAREAHPHLPALPPPRADEPATHFVSDRGDGEARSIAGILPGALDRSPACDPSEGDDGAEPQRVRGFIGATEDELAEMSDEPRCFAHDCPATQCGC